MMRPHRSDIRRYFQNQNGMSLVSSGIALVFTGFMGMAVVSASATDGEATFHHHASAKAFYAATAGLEWANYRIKHGEDPNVTDLAFNAAKPDDGRFTVNYDLTTHVITATGNADQAKSVQTMTALTAADCVESPGNFDNSFQCPTDYTNTWAAGWIGYIQLERSSRSECSDIDIRLSALNIDNLEGSQKVMQVLYDGSTVNSATPDDDGQVYSRDGVNYTGFGTGYLEDSDAGMTPVDYATANFTDIAIDDTDTHLIEKIYLVYDKYNMAAATYCPDMPASGDQISLNFIFSDGSSYNRVFTLW